MPRQSVSVLGERPLPLQSEPLPLCYRQRGRITDAQQGLPRQHRHLRRFRILRQERRLQTAELSEQ